MKFHIFNDCLYCGKDYVGFVRYIDYRDNGRHGYGVSRVRNQSLLQDFQDEAKRLFPNAENPYIEYLDKIY